MQGNFWSLLDEEERKQLWATLAFKHTQGIGARTIARLLRYFGSAFEALEQKNFWQDAGVHEQKVGLMASNSWRDSALEEWENAQRCNARIILWHHEQYPPILRNLIDAPSVLYCKGDISLLKNSCIAVVGSRQCSKDGIQATSIIARDLAKSGITVVSGMAQGIDRVAHLAALGQIGKSIGVLGTGINVAYPINNQDVYDALWEEGLLLSEFAPNTAPLASHFPIRNRIVSGLCLGTLVIEGGMRSGSLITARIALEQNREVYAVPGRIESEFSLGCQELIRQGAKAIFNAEDILHDLDLHLQNSILDFNSAQVSSEGTKIATIQGEVKNNPQKISLENFSQEEQEDIRNTLSLLHKNGAIHIDTICTLLEKPIQKVNALLVEMELLQIVKKAPGAKYIAICDNL